VHKGDVIPKCKDKMDDIELVLASMDEITTISPRRKSLIKDFPMPPLFNRSKSSISPTQRISTATTANESKFPRTPRPNIEPKEIRPSQYGTQQYVTPKTKTISKKLEIVPKPPHKPNKINLKPLLHQQDPRSQKIQTVIGHK
jgi:hypothetical protein